MFNFLKDIVVVRVNAAAMTHGGIIVPDPVRAAHVQPAVVLALGSKCKLPIKMGDVVYVSIYIGTPKTIEGREVRIYDSPDILAVQGN